MCELGKNQVQSALPKIYLIACVGEGVGGEEPGGRRGENVGFWGADSAMQAKGTKLQPPALQRSKVKQVREGLPVPTLHLKFHLVAGFHRDLFL